MSVYSNLGHTLPPEQQAMAIRVVDRVRAGPGRTLREPTAGANSIDSTAITACWRPYGHAGVTCAGCSLRPPGVPGPAHS